MPSSRCDSETPGRRISVCLPARDEEATIGAALAPLLAMQREGSIYEVVVADESTDWTARVATSMGARVFRQRDSCPELGGVLGKGDAMWRALRALHGDVILFLDADSTSIQRHYVFGMCEPILNGEADLVKGYYQRPLGGDPDGGGRVNHLLARPLLRAHFPDLSWVRQPLAGETALTRQAAWQLPFVCGYGVEMGLLLDAHHLGLRIAQADLHCHEHRHRPLGALSKMGDEIIATVLHRAGITTMPPRARPPMGEYEPLGG